MLRYLLFTVLGFFSGTVSALTIELATLEELLADADFAGVVRCEVAGGIVAGFVVEETWVGLPKVGDHIRICELPDEFENPFPYRLCGERLVVAGFKSSRFESDLSFPWLDSSATPVVHLSASTSYTLPWRQGVDRIDLDEPLIFGREFESLDAVRMAAKEFLKLSADDREEHILKARFRTGLADATDDADAEYAEALKRLLEAVENARDARSTVLAILEAARVDVEDCGAAAFEALSRGRDVTLLTLGKAEDVPFEKEVLAEILEAVMWRITPNALDALQPSNEPNEEEPSKEQLEFALETLQAKNVERHKLGSAAALVALGTVLLWPMLPQALHPAVRPVALLLALRAGLRALAARAHPIPR